MRDEPYLVEDRDDYREIWTTPPPPPGVKYRVLEDSWTDDDERPTRHIHRITIID